MCCFNVEIEIRKMYIYIYIYMYVYIYIYIYIVPPDFRHKFCQNIILGEALDVSLLDLWDR